MEGEIVEGQVITLDYGRNLVIPVHGEEGAQEGKQATAKKLYKKYGNKHLQFSLTPICDYQKDKEWPERPFLNVNVRGSIETTKENWLGYIHPFVYEEMTDVRIERNKYIKKLIEIGETTPLIISGKVIKEDDNYSMLLFASRKQIDALLPKVRKLRKNVAENNDKKRKRRIIIWSVVLAITGVLCIFFWKYMLAILIIMVVLALFSSKKH